LILFFLVTASCQPSYNCQSIATGYKKDECLLIVKSYDKIKKFHYEGINPENGKECECESYGASNIWWSEYKKYIEIGDTIIKRKGSLVFSIHKKDTILNFKYICDGTVYQ
jgi:hypothetical protein